MEGAESWVVLLCRVGVVVTYKRGPVVNRTGGGG